MLSDLHTGSYCHTVHHRMHGTMNAREQLVRYYRYYSQYRSIDQSIDVHFRLGSFPTETLKIFVVQLMNIVTQEINICMLGMWYTISQGHLLPRININAPSCCMEIHYRVSSLVMKQECTALICPSRRWVTDFVESDVINQLSGIWPSRRLWCIFNN
jgi:hypothetical protein